MLCVIGIKCDLLGIQGATAHTRSSCRLPLTLIRCLVPPRQSSLHSPHSCQKSANTNEIEIVYNNVMWKPLLFTDLYLRARLYVCTYLITYIKLYLIFVYHDHDDDDDDGDVDDDDDDGDDGHDDDDDDHDHDGDDDDDDDHHHDHDHDDHHHDHDHDHDDHDHDDDTDGHFRDYDEMIMITRVCYRVRVLFFPADS